MKTTIDNNQRVFMVCEGANKILCNLDGLQEAINSFEDKTYLKVFHIWNNAFKIASKKMMREMLHSANHMIYSSFLLK